MRPLIKQCKHCEDEFDVNSARKRRVGGYVNECPDCVIALGTESSVRYRDVTIWKFDSEAEAQACVQKWYGNNHNASYNKFIRQNRCLSTPDEESETEKEE